MVYNSQYQNKLKLKWIKIPHKYSGLQLPQQKESYLVKILHRIKGSTITMTQN